MQPSSSQPQQGLILDLVKLTAQEKAFTNYVYVSESDFRTLAMSAPSGRPKVPVFVKEQYPFLAVPDNTVQPGKIGMNTVQRGFAQIPIDDTLHVTAFKPTAGNNIVSARVEVDMLGNLSSKVEIDAKELKTEVLNWFRGQPFIRGQKLALKHPNGACSLRFVELETANDLHGSRQSALRSVGILSPDTEIEFSSGPAQNCHVLSSDMRRPQIFKTGFNFAEMEIGGLSDQLETIFRKAFASRVYPPALIRELGIKHVRGMMLYGPPGTGKTTIARKIGQVLQAREPIVKSGPEMLNMYVGEGEKQIRELFIEAEKEQAAEGENSQLHIIIIDEIDAICKQRGSGPGGSATGDSMVNQLLAKIDGINSLHNILLIGMTNRLDMIDEALLRPGRLEVKMEIGLPDQKGRVEILKIHMAKAQASKRIADDVDIALMAQTTKNYSGAELEGVVRSAASFALARLINFQDLGKEIPEDEKRNLMMTNEDFQRALGETQPLYGAKESDFKKALEFGMIEYSKSFSLQLQHLRVLVAQVRGRIKPAGSSLNDRLKAMGLSGSDLQVHQDADHATVPAGVPSSTQPEDSSKTGNTLHLSSLLLTGPPKSGKSAIASYIVQEANFPFVRFVSAENMVGMGELQKMNYINKAFEDAYKTEMSCVILDDLEK